MKSIILAALLTLCATTAATAGPTQLNICTGGETGRYYAIGQKIKAHLERGNAWVVNVIPTDGSPDNLGRMLGSNPTCDAAIIQEDVPTASDVAQLHPIVVLYEEPVVMICNDGTDDIDELTPEHTVHAGYPSGGTAVSTQKIINTIFPKDKQRPKVTDGSLSDDVGMLATLPKKHCYAQVMALQSDAMRAVDELLATSDWRYVDTYDSALTPLTGINGGTLYKEMSGPFKPKMKYDDGEFATVNSIFVITRRALNTLDTAAKRQLGQLGVMQY